MKRSLFYTIFVFIGLSFHSLAANSAEIQIISWYDKKSLAETLFEGAVKEALPDVKISYVFAERSKSKLADALRKTDYNKIDLVISGGTTPTIIVKNYLKGKKPLMFHTVSTPVLSKIADSLERPGKNITGVSSLVDLKTQMEILTKLKDIKTLGIIFDPREKQNPVISKNIKKLVSKKGIEVRGLRIIPDARNFDQLLKEAASKSGDLDAIYIVPNASYIKNMKKISKMFNPEILIMTYGREFSKLGVTVAIDANPKGSLEAAIQMAIKILKGTPTEEIPVASIRKEDIILAVNKNKVDKVKLRNLDKLGISVYMVD